MRYLVQLLIPALIVATVVYLLTQTNRARPAEERTSSDTGIFILILVVGAIVAIASFFLLDLVLE